MAADILGFFFANLPNTEIEADADISLIYLWRAIKIYICFIPRFLIFFKFAFPRRGKISTEIKCEEFAFEF